jgi:hypothetical protein
MLIVEWCSALPFLLCVLAHTLRHQRWQPVLCLGPPPTLLLLWRHPASFAVRIL